MRKAGMGLPIVIMALAGAAIPEQDSRNTSIRDMDTHFQMPVFATREDWLQKAAFLRMQILSSAGLLPMPEKTPLHAHVFGRLERGTYTVEKVLLETYPGFYLGGNLYRPLGKQGPFPAVVTPHGHWAYGRLENTSQVSVPARCINLARQGFVVFSYDMVGYNDTDQFPHGDSGPRLGGPREDLWSINTMGLQLWDSIRAVDFVSSLPEVRGGIFAAPEGRRGEARDLPFRIEDLPPGLRARVPTRFGSRPSSHLSRSSQGPRMCFLRSIELPYDNADLSRRPISGEPRRRRLCR